MNEDINVAIDKAVSDAVYQSWGLQGVLTSVVVIFALVFLRYTLVRIVRGKKEILDKDQRRWINRINNSTSVMGLTVLVFIWAPQLHTFALSLTAVAVAVVLTTKELLMCLTGGFMRASNKSFDIGDWIRVDGVMGEVLSITAMTTLIEEVDVTDKSFQFTGRSVQVPNSKFLTINVENQNFLKDYTYHNIPITVQSDSLDPVLLMKQLEKITHKYFANYKEAAMQFNKRVEKKTALNFGDVDPQFFLKTTDGGHVTYTARFFAPTAKSAALASDITRDFLSYAHKQKSKHALQKETS